MNWGKKFGPDTRGALFVESVIAYVPVLWFFFVLWQLFELMAADLVVRRAASAAARAASVVFADDPQFYGGQNSKEADIRHAAEQITKAAPQLSGVELPGLTDPGSGADKVTVTVSANFKCAGAWLAVVCGGASRRLEHSATYAYQGAAYRYEH